MDRQIVYPGSIPLDTDLLHIQRYVMASIGALARAVVGDGGLVDGFACTPHPAAYAVTVGPGTYVAPATVDGAAFGSLPPDLTSLVQTAVQPDATVLQLGPPSDGGRVICWLVQATIFASDAGAIALPYWNAANPAVPFSGPGNSGQAQATQRLLRVRLSCKPSGEQIWTGRVAPDPDPGWVGLQVVTTFVNKPGIEASDIAPAPSSPLLRFKLPALPPASTRMASFTASGVWEAPPGVNWVRVRVVGGGGGGGGGDLSFSGGGGGAGGYAEAPIGVVPGQRYPVVVGSGGAAAGPGNTGGNGGHSSFDGRILATGGQGGGSYNPDSYGGAPGQGLLGGLLLGGGFGGDGAVAVNVPGGNGGASALGGGGRGANGGGVPAAALACGAGGGGGYGLSSYGGPGAVGLVMLDF